MKLKTNRIEALTDGIFAIVMTIMIVSMSELFKLDKSVKEYRTIAHYNYDSRDRHIVWLSYA